MKQFLTVWHDNGRQPQVPFNRDRWDGVAADVSAGMLPACQAELDWPTLRCGWWEVRCKKCGMAVVVTTAGRVDDPVSIRMACKERRA